MSSTVFPSVFRCIMYTVRNNFCRSLNKFSICHETASAPSRVTCHYVCNSVIWCFFISYCEEKNAETINGNGSFTRSLIYAAHKLHRLYELWNFRIKAVTLSSRVKVLLFAVKNLVYTPNTTASKNSNDVCCNLNFNPIEELLRKFC